jgi:NAD(P)-dependent dehydrogenase (short-subunit alcohol dehydrogenase family)
MRIVLADIEEETLASGSQQLTGSGAEVEAIRADVTRVEDVEALASRAESRFGVVHVVCNNAGVAPIAPVLETRLEDWRWVFEVNLFGVVHGVSVFGPRFVSQGEGHIVNTASAGGLVSVPGFGAYCATKHAVVALSETLSQELQGTGVGVSVLCPGLVATRIFESERNRPNDGGPTDYGEIGANAKASIAQVGTPPGEIAAHVVTAIQEERLHILPSPEIKPVIEERFRRILAGESLPEMAELGES